MIKKIQKNMNKKGFTLVELIIVLAVMAILAAIVIPRMSGITETFRNRADLRSCETIARELEVKIQLGAIADLIDNDGNEIAGSGNCETTLNGGAIAPPQGDDGDETDTDDFFFTFTLDDGVGTLTVFVGDAANDNNDDNVEFVITPVNRVE